MPNVPLKIAVVDDDFSIRDMAVTILSSSKNRNVFSYENGVTAWTDLELDGRADIIVTDINMPGMDGLELLGRIKRRYPGKICIMMSGDPAYEKAAFHLGADAFLTKPFKLNELSDIVKVFEKK